MKSVRISQGADGFFYIDAKRTSAGSFKPDSRQPALDDAFKRCRELLGGRAVTDGGVGKDNPSQASHGN